MATVFHSLRNLSNTLWLVCCGFGDFESLTVNQSPPPLVFLLKTVTMSATAVSYVVSSPNSLGPSHFSSRTRPRNGFVFSSVATLPTPSWRNCRSLRPPSIFFRIPHGFSKRRLQGSKPFSPVMEWQDCT